MTKNSDTAAKPQGEASIQKCKICKLPIPVGASKCSECSGWQDWRRYIMFSGTILSLLVALVSVLTFAVPIWKKALTPSITLPPPVLVEVSKKGEAKFIITNGGKESAVLEYIVLGANDGVLQFDLSTVSSIDRTINANGVRIISVPLAVDFSTEYLDVSETSVWDLVKIYRSQENCMIQVGVISSSGERKKALVNVSKAGLDETEGYNNGCQFKIKKLAQNTVINLLKTPGFEEVLCEVIIKHPKDPGNPKIGTACLKYVD